MVDGGKLVTDDYADDIEEITDQVGNSYPTDSFDESDLDENGYLTDERGRQYDPFGGNRVPADGRCNALLQAWEDRYDEPRYCSQFVHGSSGEYFYSGFCPVHKHREALMKTAEEALQSGAYAQSIDHLYEGVSGWHRLIAHGTFEYLLGESIYEYAPEYEPKKFDFSDAEMQPDFADADGEAELKVAYPTDHGDRALGLWQAAMDRVNMLTIKAVVSEGDHPLESKTTEHAQLTAPPSEDTPDQFKEQQHFKTIEEWTEHHLNLPYDRLVRSHDKHLEYGGVGVDVDDGTQDMNVDEIVLDVSADPEEVESSDMVDDPNSYEDQPESETILEHAKGE